MLDTVEGMSELQRIRVVIADDQELVRAGFAMVIGSQPDIQVVGQAGDGAQAVSLAESLHPDVVLMDVRMPEMNGLQCLEAVRKVAPRVKVIVLTTFEDDEYIFDALKHGAYGYLLKGTSMKHLYESICSVYQGNAILDQDIVPTVVSEFSRMAQGVPSGSMFLSANADDLSENERMIVEKVSCGYSNREIAALLSLSEGTVRNYLSNILSKLNLRDRTQLAVWALRGGLQKMGGRSGADQ